MKALLLTLQKLWPMLKVFCRLIDCLVFNLLFNIISVTPQISVRLLMLSWSSFLTSFLENILSKPLAALLKVLWKIFFPSHWLLCWNNGKRWQRNESCPNDYHQLSFSHSLPLWKTNLIFWLTLNLLSSKSSYLDKVEILISDTGLSTSRKRVFRNHCGKRRKC